jgi:hypothetical protein
VAKLRQKRTGLRFVDCSQASMIVLRDLERAKDFASGKDAKGAYVKVAPTIRAHERQSFDSKAIRDALLEAGALAVIIAPIVVPEVAAARKHEPVSQVRPEEYLKQWFAVAKSAKELGPDAMAEALQTLGEAGL